MSFFISANLDTMQPRFFESSESWQSRKIPSNSDDSSFPVYEEEVNMIRILVQY